MKRKIVTILLIFILIFSVFTIPTCAATDIYTVVKGDSLWKIAVRYKVGLSEIISANPQFKNPNLIYPGDKVTVPLKNETVTSYEQQVIDLVNNISCLLYTSRCV